MNEVEQPSERTGERLARRVGCASHRLFKNVLHAKARKRRAVREDTLFGSANENRRERTKRRPVGLQHVEARLQRKDESLSPSALGHGGCLSRKFARELVIQ